VEDISGEVSLEFPEDLDRSVVLMSDVMSAPCIEIRRRNPEEVRLGLANEEVD
jgi:hypothetical protein